MKYNTVRNLKWILSNAWKLDKLIFWYIFLYMISNSFLSLILVVMPKVILDGYDNQIVMNRMVLQIIMLLVLYLVCFVISRTADNLSWPRYILIRMKVKKVAADGFMTVKQEMIENPDILDMCERANAASSYNINGFEGMFRRFVKILGVVISFIGCIALIGSVNRIMVLIVLVCAAVTFVFNTSAREYEKKVNDEMTIMNRKRDYAFKTMYNFKNGKDIRLYHMDNWLVREFRKISLVRRGLLWNIEKKKCVSNVVASVMTTVVELFLYIILIYAVIKENCSIGTYTMCAAAIRTLFSTLNVMLDDLAHIRQQSLLVNDLYDFIHIDREEESMEDITFDASQPYEIVLKNVSFQYPGSNKYALKNISLTIKKGEKLGIVGLNGSGKTTLIKLITKLYEPTSGQIFVNGIDINTLNRHQYYKMFSVVFQDIVAFAFPLYENVSMLPEDDTDMDKVMDCLAKAGLSDKVNSLKNGVNTALLKIIDEEGIELSGGENQKLALARALYKDAAYLILDEPTAAFDALAEQRIYTTFHEMAKDKTALFISHRLSSTKFCDHIAMFEYGKLIEYGTHNELLKKGGKYYEMFEIQAKYYKEGDGTCEER